MTAKFAFIVAFLVLVTATPAAASAASPTCATPDPPPPGTELVVDPATTTAPSGAAKPVDAAVRRRVMTGVDNFVRCINSGDHRRAAMLFTPYLVSSFMGQRTYDQVPAILGGLRISHFHVTAMTAYADGSFTTETRYLAFGHQLVDVRVTWWPDRDGYLKVNGMLAHPSPVRPGTPQIGVEMGENFFHLSRTTVCAPRGNVLLSLKNIGSDRHEAILLRLPPGATGADIFNGVLTPEQVVSIGQENGGPDLSLIRLRPGTYTLVDFIPASDGKPHGMHGMHAQFTVRC
jgi:hypothetical protein